MRRVFSDVAPQTTTENLPLTKKARTDTMEREFGTVLPAALFCVHHCKNTLYPPSMLSCDENDRTPYLGFGQYNAKIKAYLDKVPVFKFVY
jgi:hypothetical protein